MARGLIDRALKGAQIIARQCDEQSGKYEDKNNINESDNNNNDCNNDNDLMTHSNNNNNNKLKR